MIIEPFNQIENTINTLFNDTKKDQFKIMKGLAKSAFRPIKPEDFKDVYLSITKKQGEFLKEVIIENKLKNIIEFGTSFGISTLFLAQGALVTNGKIITTELIASKAKTALSNFKSAGVNSIIEIRIGDAMETLKNYMEPIDLLFLDGWKDLYLPLFQMLEPNFNKNTIIYVDNADMKESQTFLKVISKMKKYESDLKFDGKVALITTKK